jgi:hypothetical protein
LGKFSTYDDIYIGIEAVIEKLNHYYDKISPIVGICLILDPKRKKQYLQNILNWQPSWVASVMEHFQNSFEYYRKKVSVNKPAPISIASLIGGFGEFEKKQRLIDPEAGTNSVEEYLCSVLQCPVSRNRYRRIVFLENESIPLSYFISDGQGLFGSSGFKCLFREGIFFWN